MKTNKITRDNAIAEAVLMIIEAVKNNTVPVMIVSHGEIDGEVRIHTYVRNDVSDELIRECLEQVLSAGKKDAKTKTTTTTGEMDPT